MKLIRALLVTVVFSGSVLSEDNLAWLRDDSREKTEVLDYLKKENDLTQQYQAQIQPFSDALLNEWRKNTSVRSEKPWREISGFEYAVQSRKLLSRPVGSADEIELFDIAKRATTFDYYQLGAWALSPSRTQLAIAEDLDGSEQYTVSIVDLDSGVITKLASKVEASVTWALDEQSLFLIKQETQTTRPFAVVEYELKSASEKLIFQESDTAWLVSTYLTSDKKFSLVQSNSDSSSEQRLLNLETGKLSKPIRARQAGVEYYADKFGNQFYINSNHERSGFELYLANSTSADSESPEFTLIEPLSQWQPLLEARGDTHVSNFYWFASGVVAVTESGSDQYLNFINNKGELTETQKLAQSGQVAWVSQVGDFDSNKLHIRSMSMIQPAKWEKLNTQSLQREVFSQDAYPNFKTAEYHTEQVLIKNGDEWVPVTLAYRKDQLTEKSPVLLYGYGAYGVTMKPYFMPQIISLLDKGMIYAIAHVRGSGYNGKAWYQEGKGTNKLNSISDFVASAKSLKHYKQGDRPIYAMGSSAGGTLVSAALNQDPNAFDAAILKVPFVDVVNSMSDETLPLTAQQYGEWGNPNIAEELAMMKAYDPYLNIVPQEYPPTLVQVGLHDRRVPYWEGAKYFEKLRSASTGSGPYFLSTNFNQGHSTDRRQSLSQQAFEYAFFLSITQQQDNKAEQ
ncbi:prolyl oligopeptidase family serine peptidase [Vibrio sp. 99-70-13A1]|uniref:prolyl oligopeptidase family serine peptidase n=1 Tax=Vibrio sp. 99-70-13A1 TaxID=2607601 RepID=UPI00149356E9|nr:prolyl oligopeptidase family serine peptidase [Vibrio sp. 99-70-13A1]NOH97153.1 S9 family peptidase [Vibrio sp. 99-70-13A1]